MISETVKLLEENNAEKLLDIGLCNDFLDKTVKAQGTKSKVNKWDYIKLESSCAARKKINKIKDGLKDGIKCLQTKYLMRSLYLKYIKNSYNNSRKKKADSKLAEALNRHFSK